jgi:ATP-dependent RNA helicase SUPV3L1/SUV3
MEVEARLSDALHERLTQRFVDRRTAVLVRDIGARGADALPVTVAADGEVSVGPEPIGHLIGFDFKVDPTARLADKRLLMAAADRRLGDELDRRAKTLLEAPDEAFALIADDGENGPSPNGLGFRRGQVAVGWEGQLLARLAPGRSFLEPALRTSRALDRLSAPSRAALRGRLEAWLEASIARHLGALKTLASAATDPASSPGVRALCAMLTDSGGVIPRRAMLAPIAALEPADRRILHRLRIRLGALDLFVAPLLKPEPQRWRAALAAVRAAQPMPVLPPPGAALLGPDADPRGAALAYRRLGNEWLRIDLADRLASHAYKARAAGAKDPVDAALARSVGLDEAGIARLMAELGFARAGEAWRWRGRRARRAESADRRPSNPFAALADLKP